MWMLRLRKEQSWNEIKPCLPVAYRQAYCFLKTSAARESTQDIEPYFFFQPY
jgi:hypothetical protein